MNQIKKTDLSEILTQQEFKSTEEDIYSSEERAKAEQIISIVMDYVMESLEIQDTKEMKVTEEAMVNEVMDLL